MEFNKPVTNPMLLGCIELMKEENTPEHRNMFIQELTKASYMAPAMINPAPVEEEDGRVVITPGSKIQFPMLFTQDGKRFFMAFTDQKEYDSWQEKNHKLYPFTLKIQDYAEMLLRNDPMGNPFPALGLVINPYGANIVVTREMLAGIMSARMGSSPFNRAMQMAQHTAPENPGDAPNSDTE